MTVRMLSLHQPWASLIASGQKTIETRGWQTAYRGDIAIHATKAFPDDAIRLCFEEPFKTALKASGISVLADLPRGAIVAVARLVECRSTSRTQPWVGGLPIQERAFGDYSPGRFGWVLSDIRPLAKPVECRGMPGLMSLPVEVETMVEAHLGAGEKR